MKANLKVVEPNPRTLRDHVREALAVRAERRDMERMARQKMRGDAAVARACQNAKCDLTRVEELDATVRELPHTQEWQAIPAFVTVIKEQAAALPGDLVPPVANLCRRELYAELSVACLNLRCSPLELVALGWWRATQEHPEVFADGCADPDEHEARIAALKQREQELLLAASNATTFDDLLWSWVGVGQASVAYAVAPSVAASRPGDPRGAGALCSYFEAHPEEMGKLE